LFSFRLSVLTYQDIDVPLPSKLALSYGSKEGRGAAARDARTIQVAGVVVVREEMVNAQ
jgi:hypothetical protein